MKIERPSHQRPRVLGTGRLHGYDQPSMIGWLTPAFKKTFSEPCGLLAGFVVTERDTGREIHREMMDVSHLNIEKASAVTWKRYWKLARKYNSYRYDVQDGMYSSREAFEHFSPRVFDR
jgi:hypothetical protein